MKQQRFQFHIGISGFLQSEGKENGILNLTEKLSAAGFNRHAVRVWYRPWNSDWAEVAEHIWNIGQKSDVGIDVNIFAYSWGVGWGSMQLATELGKRGIDVQHLVSCDGVYRHPQFWLRWLSLTKRNASLAPVIRVPSNVLEVHPFHQRQNRPQGHELVATSTAQRIHRSIERTRTHQFMDDDAAFHDRCLRVARGQSL